MSDIVTLKNLTYSYGEDSASIKNINLSLKKGEAVVITGGSGGGKSTILKCINGIIPHFYPNGKLNGEVTVSSITPEEIRLEEMCDLVGSVFQDPRSQFFTTNTTSELAFGLENIKMSSGDIKKNIEITAKKLKIERLLDKSLFQISSGEKQIIAIGSVYAMGPEILVLDEPFANLDIESAIHVGKVLNDIKQQGVSLVLAEHRLWCLKDLADRIIFMKNGNLIKEWSNPEFYALTGKETNALGLRDNNPISLEFPENTARKDQEAIELRNVNYTYKSKEFSLSDISFSAAKGEIICLFGRNGSGKTTLSKVICGLLKQKSGSIYINNIKTSAKKRCAETYLVMQDADYQLFTESVETELGISSKDCESIEQKISDVLELLNLKCEQDAHPHSLSGGQKQRVTIGSAIISDCEILLFDEPTSGLDEINMSALVNILKDLAKQGRTIFIITHDYEFLIKCATRMIYLEQGRIKNDILINKKNSVLIKNILEKMQA